jgi:hypothetical protein
MKKKFLITGEMNFVESHCMKCFIDEDLEIVKIIF